MIVDGLMSAEIRSLVHGTAEICKLPNVGMEESFLFTLREIDRRKMSELVYLIEDDYLHLPTALEVLEECYGEGFADYITLFDDPLRYKLSVNVPPDLPTPNELYVSRSSHWRVIESTTFTFAARGQAIREHMEIFTRHVLERAKTRNYVMDRELWRHLQGLGPYAANGTRCRLVGAIPALATHCETTALSPTVDWQKVVDEVNSFS
jgi:hypothetical protein